MIVAKLRQVDVLASQGKSIAEAIRAIGVTEVTYYRCGESLGGLKSDPVKRLKDLEAENARLRRAVSDLTLDKMILAEAASTSFLKHRRGSARWQPLRLVERSQAIRRGVALFFPSLWSRLFTNDPAVLESARIYLVWSGLAFSFYGLGLSLYFASQGAGKVLGPVLAGMVRLAVVLVGGLLLAHWNEPQWTMFVVVGVSMVAYGLSTAGFIWITPWERAKIADMPAARR